MKKHLILIFVISILGVSLVFALNPILEYVGDWMGEVTIRTKLVNSGETREEWSYYIKPSFKIGEDGSLTGTAMIKFSPINFSIMGTKCEVIYPQRDEFPMTGGLLWIPGYEILGTTDSLLGNISFYLPEGPGGSATFKGTGECIKCTDEFSYNELPQYILEILPIMSRGEIEQEPTPNYFSFGNKTLIDLEKVEKSLGFYCASIKGSGILVRPAKILALNFKGNSTKSPSYFSEAMGFVWKEGEGEPLRIKTKFNKWDEITTKPDSKVKVKLDGKLDLSLNENSKIRLESESELSLIFGEIYSKIKPGTNYKVRIPTTAACAVRGTQFITNVEKDGAITLTVLDGEVEFSDTQKKKTVLVKKNQKSVCNPEGLPSEPVSIEPNQISKWWE